METTKVFQNLLFKITKNLLRNPFIDSHFPKVKSYKENQTI